jgi:hypothetical protein
VPHEKRRSIRAEQRRAPKRGIGTAAVRRDLAYHEAGAEVPVPR